MEKVTLQKLESTLWNTADILRGELNASEYKDYIFSGSRREGPLQPLPEYARQDRVHVTREVLKISYCSR